MRVFPKAIVLTTKSHFHVKRTYASIRGLVVRTITSGKTCISAIAFRKIISWQQTPLLTKQINFQVNLSYYKSFRLFKELCSTNPCDINAGCTDTTGSYICTCNTGFTGSGIVCTGKMLIHSTCC